MKKCLLITYLLLGNKAFSQSNDSLFNRYDSCLSSLTKMVAKGDSFKKAVFITENCYLNNGMRYEQFDKVVGLLANIARAWKNENPLISTYQFTDREDFLSNFAIFKLMKDTVRFVDSTSTYFLKPYSYDFDDFWGYKDWSKMFVSKLLDSHKGNCHSLPYLYKILADELGAKCWLSLAPNHIYIKNRCQKIGWYNTELTSGSFPIDAWIATSGYVPMDAIRSGIYMDTLSNQQAIALCVLDLAKGYEFQAKNYEDGFILKCCDLVLKYHPVNVQALLLKAETIKRLYQKYPEGDKGKAYWAEMEQAYKKLFDLGYREMPEKMYLQWLRSVNVEKGKYENKKLKETLTKK